VLLKLLKEMKDQLVYSIFEEDIFSWWSDAFASLSEKSSGELLQEKVDEELESFSETLARLLFILYKYDFSEVAGDPLGDLYQQYFDKETRKALGEFYTPVEVVNYILDAVEYKYVRHKRLLDPACGSGTFLVEALKRYLKEMEPVAKEKGWAFVLRELCNSPRIVGFDIHPFACLIAQVRFMLELIPYYKKAIDEEKIAVQTSLQRLPIFRTDSLLIELEPSEVQPSPKLLVTEEDLRFMVYLPIKMNSEEAVTVKVMIPTWRKTLVGTQYNLFNLDEYFCVTQAIFDTVKIMVREEATEVPVRGLAAYIKKYLSNKDFDAIAEFFKPYADNILSEIKRLQKEFEDGRLVKSIEDAVLSALLKNYVKYDFVTGNPPYVRVQKLPKELRNYYHNKYASACGKFDIYLLFIERGIKWLEKSGRLGYICSNQFLARDYGREIKRQIGKNCTFKQLIDFGDSGVFSDVTNYPCIMILEKGKDDSKVMSVARVAKPLINNENQDITLEYIRKNLENDEICNEYLDIFKLEQSVLDSDIWEIMPKRERDVFHKILKNSTVLFKDLREQVYEGFISGANSIFFVDEEKILGFSMEMEILKPVPKGKDVRKWRIIWKNRYVIYPHKEDGSSLSEEDMKSKYPNIYAYLQQYKTTLKRRKYYGKTPEELHGTWFALVHPKPKKLFTMPKIIVPNLSTQNDFAFDPQGIYYVDHDCYGIILKSKEKSHFLYMLGLLNSSVLEFFLKHISPYASGKYYRYMTGYIDQLPIKLPKTTEE
ncbi:MAG: N-6 DNA methylase, partial [Candidatus Jordarchaeaceae archaeon]